MSAVACYRCCGEPKPACCRLACGAPSVKKKEKKTRRRAPWVVTLPSSDVCVPAALRAESEPRPECHSGGSALHAAAEGLHKSKVEIRELGEVEFAPCLATDDVSCQCPVGGAAEDL